MERDIGHVAIATGEGISTHTLTWSVTVTPSYVAVTSAISTHTLTWSVTLADFLWNADETISTHTLTWSVTSSLLVHQWYLAFQLTRSRGA